MTRSLIILTVLLMMMPGHIDAQSSRRDLSWDTDPNGGRLLFTPTARIIPERKGAVSLYELMLPMVSFTVSDDLVLSVGTPLAGDGEGSQVLAVSGKLRLPTHRKFEAALAAMTLFGGPETMGFLFGVVTVGDDERSLSGGVGYSYYSNEHLLYKTGRTSTDGTSFFFGGDIRLGPALKLVSENMFLPASDTIVSLGVRFIGEKISVDLGAGLIRPERDPLPYPVINIAWNW